jgi:hypothetical protein
MLPNRVHVLVISFDNAPIVSDADQQRDRNVDVVQRFFFFHSHEHLKTCSSIPPNHSRYSDVGRQCLQMIYVRASLVMYVGDVLAAL